MKTYDEEATQLDDNTSIPHTEANVPEEVKAKSSKEKLMKRAAAGAASGLLIGGVSTVLMGMKGSDEAENQGDSADDNPKEQLSNPEWVDDEVSVATSVNDDMTFGEAFAAARAEVGPGGCFEWHGNLYGTYTAEEWKGMTAEQRADWSDHFSWNHIDHSESQVAQHSPAASHHTADTTQAAPADDNEIEVISVNHAESGDTAQNQPRDNVHQASSEVVVEAAEPEVEILGVVHDPETDANIGGMSIDGQDFILIDVNNDLTFDYMSTDADGNGRIEEDEIFDIQEQNLSVNDLGGFANPADNLQAENEGPDYSNESLYDV